VSYRPKNPVESFLMWKTIHGLTTQYQIPLDETTDAEASVVRDDQSYVVVMWCSRWKARAVFTNKILLFLECIFDAHTS
jgi:hypothetical protein